LRIGIPVFTENHIRIFGVTESAKLARWSRWFESSRSGGSGSAPQSNVSGRATRSGTPTPTRRE
jgi:hypothetical protein